MTFGPNLRKDMKRKILSGTRSFHQFIPITDLIVVKLCTQFYVFPSPTIFKITSCRIGLQGQSMCQMMTTMPSSLISKLCIYLGLEMHCHHISVSFIYMINYWVVINMEVSTENLDVKVKFMHLKLPAPSFIWPIRDDLCWVPDVHI